MKITKKILVIAVSIIMIFSMIGCSTKNSKNTSTDNQTIEEGSNKEDGVVDSEDNDVYGEENQGNSNQAEDLEDNLEGSQEENQSEENTSTEIPVGFYVEGSKLYDANGNEFIMRGVNHAHTWFKGYGSIALEAIAATGANAVRIVLSNGEKYQKDDIFSVIRVIDKCKELNMIAILEVHDATGDNTIESLEKAADYWIQIKKALNGNEAYVILNIANEWYGQWSETTWRDGYVSVIPRIREAGIYNTIMVDSAGWGQYPKSIETYGKEVFESDPLGNTMFSIHMYGSAGKNAELIKNNIDSVINQDLSLTIGEFGYNHSDGDVDEDYIMSYCSEVGVGYLGWSWKGNGGGVEYLDIALQWDGSELSTDWGEKLINGEYGIKNTSQICTVFE